MLNVYILKVTVSYLQFPTCDFQYFIAPAIQKYSSLLKLNKAASKNEWMEIAKKFIWLNQFNYYRS